MKRYPNGFRDQVVAEVMSAAIGLYENVAETHLRHDTQQLCLRVVGAHVCLPGRVEADRVTCGFPKAESDREDALLTAVAVHVSSPYRKTGRHLVVSEPVHELGTAGRSMHIVAKLLDRMEQRLLWPPIRCVLYVSLSTRERRWRASYNICIGLRGTPSAMVHLHVPACRGLVRIRCVLGCGSFTRNASRVPMVEGG